MPNALAALALEIRLHRAYVITATIADAAAIPGITPNALRYVFAHAQASRRPKRAAVAEAEAVRAQMAADVDGGGAAILEALAQTGSAETWAQAT